MVFATAAGLWTILIIKTTKYILCCINCVCIFDNDFLAFICKYVDDIEPICFQI